MISVYDERPIEGGLVRRRYETVLTDNIATEHTDIHGMYNHLPENNGSEVEASALEGKKQAEIQYWISEMEAMRDPAHIDMGGYFEHSVPLWHTWEECLDASLTHYLQQSYMQEILKCDLTCSRLTNKELEAVAGKPNDVRGEQSIATNTQVELDSYIPLIDENGVPR